MSAEPEGGGTPRQGAAEGVAAVLFDMDGLLVDTEPLWFETEAAIMARMGGVWSEADQRRLVGGALERSVAYMRAHAPRPAGPAQVARWMVDGMAALVRQRGAALMPGAEALLAEVTRAGLPHALVTSADRAIMEAVIETAGLAFPVTVCGQDVRRRKPDPEPYLRAASLLGADPRRCVALDDSPSGVASAAAAGCAVIAVPSVPLTRPDGALVVSSLAELDLSRLAAAASRR